MLLRRGNSVAREVSFESAALTLQVVFLDIGQAQPQIMRAEIPPLVQSTGGGAPSCPCPTASQAPSKKDRLLAELARIVAVADAVDAMTSDRSYRR